MSNPTKSASNNNDEMASDDKSLANASYAHGVKALRNTIVDILNTEPILNKLELMSLHALIAYTSYDKKVSEEIVSALVKDRFSVDQIEHLQRAEYDQVIRYLVDLDPQMLVN
jgi:hypothetical protein